MKTNPTPPPSAAKTTRATGTHNTRAVESGVFSSDEPAATASHEGGRDFASVLEEATRARCSGSDNLSDNNLAGRLKDELAHDRAGADQTDNRAASQSRAGEKTGARSSSSNDEDDKRRGDEGGERGHGFEALGLPRETLLQRGEAVGIPVNARAILHIVDLERIVALVRTQIAPGGRHEITIELTRSTLEGLRIKLSRDAGGRIDAELSPPRSVSAHNSTREAATLRNCCARAAFRLEHSRPLLMRAPPGRVTATNAPPTAGQVRGQTL